MASLIFNKYEKIRRLAQGGMGDVFLARQRGLVGFDRLVILKALREDLADEKEFVDQFLDEARVAATLNHPNIVALYEVDIWEGTYFMAMEYINGEDLSRLWYAAAKAGVGLPFQVSVRVIHDAAMGLDHAHFAKDVTGAPLKIVHRDVSPQNIMVRADGVTKVVDFGIAKAANRITKTQAGTVKGKLQYMSPEQVRGEVLDGRSDEFSLGTVLWEMCTGKRLFKADSELETLNKILQHPIPRPSEIVDAFPHELERVIMRMLERDRERRYPRLRDAARDLKNYLDHAAQSAGEQNVADFVEEILGEELAARTRDLTPEDPDAGVNTLENVPRPGAGVVVRKASGEEVTMTSMSALQQGILEGMVKSDDVVSEDGGASWRPLSQDPAMEKFFQVAGAVEASGLKPSPTIPAQEALEQTLEPPPNKSQSHRVGTGFVISAEPDELYPADEATEIADEENEATYEAPDDYDPSTVEPSNPLHPRHVAEQVHALPPQPTQPVPQPQAQPAPQPPPPAPAPAPLQHGVPDASYVGPSPDALVAEQQMALGSLDAVPETGQWSLGAVQSSGGPESEINVVPGDYRLPTSLSQEIEVPKNRSLRRFVAFALLGAMVAVIGGLVTVLLKPELVEPYVAGLREKIDPGVEAPKLDEAMVLSALRSFDEAKQASLAKTLKDQGPDGAAAAAMLMTEVARSRGERVRMAGIEQKLLDDARASAKAHQARALKGGSPLARLAAGAAQGERGALIEMEADLEAARATLKAPWTLESKTVQGLAHAMHEKSAADRAAAVKALVDDGGEDRRVRYVALLTASKKDDAWRDDVNAYFGEQHKKWRDAVLALGPKSGSKEPKKKDPPKVNEPVDTKRLLARANAAQKRGSRSAVGLYRRVLKAEPDNVDALVGLGWAYLDAGKNKSARVPFKKALAKSPKRAEAALGLAEALRYSGDGAGALPYYERFLKYAPSGSEAEVARKAIADIKKSGEESGG